MEVLHALQRLGRAAQRGVERGRAVGGEPCGGAAEETGAGLTGLGREQFSVGQPRAVIDGNMQILPPDPACAMAAPVALVRGAARRIPGDHIS